MYKPILVPVISPSHLEYYEKYFKPSFDMHVSDEYNLRPVFIEQNQADGDYYGTNWTLITRSKIESMINELHSAASEYVLFSDMDVIFVDKVKNKIEQALKDKDIVFQIDNKKGTYCTGFFAARTNDRVKDFFNYYLEKYNLGKDDQDNMYSILNIRIDTSLRVGGLPREFFSIWRVNGCSRYYGGEIAIPTYPIVVFHTNWTIGKENKLKLLEAYYNKYNTQIQNK